jgi:CelD/BcsL family acetyltransferase involved in cellulose biosynthesis
VTPDIVFAAESDFDFASDEYRVLFRHARCSAFQHSDWLTPFYRMARTRQAEPLIMVGRRAGTAELAAVVPLIRRRTGNGTAIEYAFLGVTDYACPVIDPAAIAHGDRARLGRHFLRALGAFDRLDIRPVREGDLAAWETLLPCEPTALGFGAHHLQRSAPTGPDLARKVKRLGKQGVLALEMVSRDDIPDAMMAARRFRAGRFRDDPMQVDASFAFYVEVALRGQSSGTARLYRLSCGGDLVAVLFGLIYQGRFYYLVLGCDYPRYGRFSPGMIMFARAMDDWFGSGGAIFDFTVGDEAFKSALGCARTPMYRFLLGGAIRAARREVEHVDA